MNKSLIALALVAACGASDRNEGNGAAPVENGAPSQGPAAQAPSPAGSASLTGLYEGGPANQPNQLCIIDQGAGAAQFGLVVWGANLTSCAGSGNARRDGDTLRLEMTGDETCRIEARISGGTVTLPQGVPAGCSYYCGPTAQFGGPPLTQKGRSVEDALKAKDLVGEPLCSH